MRTATVAEKAKVAPAPLATQYTKRAEREHEHDWNEHRGDAIGEPLHRRLARLRPRDEPRDLRERRVGAHALGLDHEPSTDVDRCPGDRVARADLDRNALAGQQRPVDGRVPVDDDAVGRDLLAGPDDEQVADREPVDGDGPLRPVRLEDRRVFRPELDERAQRSAGTPLRTSLEVAPGEHEGHDDGRDLEIDLIGRAGARRGQV